MTIETRDLPNDELLASLPYPALVIDGSQRQVWQNRRWAKLTIEDDPESEAALQEVIQIAMHSIRSAPESRKQYTTIPDYLREHLRHGFEGVFIAKMDEHRTGADHFYVSLMDIPRMDDSFWRVWDVMATVADEERLFSMFYWNVYRHEDGRPHFYASDFRPNGGFEIDCDLDDLPTRFEFVNYVKYRQYLLDLIEGRAEGKRQIIAHARTPLGRDRYFETIGEATPNDPRLLASGLSIDVTAMVQVREAQEQTARLQATSFSLSGVAHALNNVLTSCYASVDMLGYEISEDEADPQRKELNRLSADLKRGQHISQALMRLAARGSSLPSVIGPDYRAPKSSGVTAHSLQRIADAVEAIAHRVELTSEIEIDGIPTFHDVDEERLAGAVLNIALNAIRAISEKTDTAPAPFAGRLSLKIESHGARPQDWPLEDTEDPCKYGCLQITIEDNGIGMSDEIANRCTEPFFTTDAEHGSGLGLSETLALAMATKGSLKVTSQEGVGSKVMIFLPAPTPT